MANPARTMPLAARAEATEAAVTVTPNPGMVMAGTATVMAPVTVGRRKGCGAGAGAGAEETRASRQANTSCNRQLHYHSLRSLKFIKSAIFIFQELRKVMTNLFKPNDYIATDKHIDQTSKCGSL